MLRNRFYFFRYLVAINGEVKFSVIMQSDIFVYPEEKTIVVEKGRFNDLSCLQ